MLVNSIVPITAGKIRNGEYKNPFDGHLGVNIGRDFISSNERSVVTTTPPDTARNVHGSVHGGYTASLLDTVASGTVYSAQPNGLKDDEYALTASLNIEFKKPVVIGRKYTCEGTVVGREGNNIQTKAALTDDQGVQVATATALVKARRADY